MKTYSKKLSSFTFTSLFPIFCLFCLNFCLLFRNSQMLREFIDRYIIAFFDEIQVKKENLKTDFWVLEFWCPNLQTNLPNDLDTSLALLIKFLQCFFDLAIHHFIAGKQRQFFKKNMASLKFDEAALVLDFGENHSFNNQGCARSYHWNNAKMRQQPIHLHLNPETKKSLMPHSYISNYMTHGTITIYASLKIYSSDGSSIQYKN